MAKVGIIMGSDSDLEIMQEAARMLEYFEISYELTIVSAHRTPQRLFDYASKAAEKGIRVIIAGAGGAAHLPGMVASITAIPVIGVPVKSSNLSGVDSLYSIVQMPPGVPVGTMAINGAKNAGIYAVQILATFDEKLAQKVQDYKERLKNEVEEKAKKLERVGYEEYLNKTDLL
ncbi:MAG: 5-(carboxyamino)imidazole ribonucleotide mutase [Bacteroidetes bacterium]|nr:5-(carboxyamino)imidazole ribonucleotide mutase [Bacteroidota bacterium]